MVVAAGIEQGYHHAHVAGGLVVAAEQIVFAPEGDWPDFLLGEVVVQEYAAVFKVVHHVGPAVVGICDGFAQQGILAVVYALVFHPLLHFVKDGFGAGKALIAALIIGHAGFVAFVFDAV